MDPLVPLALLTLLSIPAGRAQPARAGGAPSVAAADAGQPQAPSAPEIEAVGVVRSPSPARSVAILRSLGRTRVVAIGESAFGARLVSIGADTVTLDVAGAPLELRLARIAAAPPPGAAPPPSPHPADGPPEDPATPARDMDKRQVQLRLGEEMNRILSETALVPVMEDGHVVGVQITRIAEGSLLTDAGLRAGDVLTRVNGTEIDGMASLIALWPRLQSATDLNAVVLRGGQPFSLRVSLK